MGDDDDDVDLIFICAKTKGKSKSKFLINFFLFFLSGLITIKMLIQCMASRFMVIAFHGDITIQIYSNMMKSQMNSQFDGKSRTRRLTIKHQ